MVVRNSVMMMIWVLENMFLNLVSLSLFPLFRQFLGDMLCKSNHGRSDVLRSKPREDASSHVDILDPVRSEVHAND
jgi:hypothetical protein